MPNRNKFYHMMYTQQIKHLHYDDITQLVKCIEIEIKPEKYALIIHDRDQDATGKLVEPHVHLMMSFNNARHITSIANKLHDEPQYLSKWNDKWENGYAYLTHRTKDAKLKHQYDPSEVIANFDYIKLLKDLKNKEKYSQNTVAINPLLDAIVAGILTKNAAEELLSGSQLARNEKILDAAHAKWLDRHAMQWRKQKEAENAIMTVIWLYGSSGTGKTSLAKHYADKKGEPYFISGSNRDVFQSYYGQHTIILDEFRANIDISYADLLKMLDPHSIIDGVMAPARYHDRALACDLFIITSPYSPRDYYDDLIRRRVVRRGIDNFDQLLRRITLTIHMTGTEIQKMDYQNILEKYIADDSLTKNNMFSSQARPTPIDRSTDIFDSMIP